MKEVIAAAEVPRTAPATEATRLVRERTSPLIYHHSRPVFLVASIWARETGLTVDPELLYLAALFHDSAPCDRPPRRRTRAARTRTSGRP
jgi:HD superfamily phosphodiesterase